MLAQAGCWVPARFMSLSPFERLFTRMGTGDCLETNSSSFMVEMQVMPGALPFKGFKGEVHARDLWHDMS